MLNNLLKFSNTETEVTYFKLTFPCITGCHSNYLKGLTFSYSVLRIRRRFENFFDDWGRPKSLTHLMGLTVLYCKGRFRI